MAKYSTFGSSGSIYLCDAHLLVLVPEELACVFDDQLIRELGVRLLLTQSENFPQSYSECPHITGHGELTLKGQSIGSLMSDRI